MTFLLSIYKEEGIKGFYKGINTTLGGAILSFGLYFFFYRMMKRIFLSRKKTLSNLDIMFITWVAGTLNTVLTHPVWMVQTRMCIEKEKKSFLKHCKEIKNEGGYKAFMKGILPNLILVINPIINFVIYEKLRKKLVKGSAQPGFLAILSISFIAKAIATLITYPMLTVKTLAYIERGNKTMVEMMGEVYKENGI